MIQLKNVTKKYQNTTALRHLTCEIPQGQIVGIIGPNGTGKTTLMNLISGLAQTTNGEVIVNERRVDKRTIEQVSFLPQKENYYSFYTVEDMIQLQAALFSDFCQKTASELIEIMKIPKNIKIGKFSKGFCGRVKIVLTLSRKAPYILMDEPFSGLDTEARSGVIQSIIQFINLEKQTLLISTHELKEVDKLLETLVVLRDNELKHVISVEQIQSEKEMGLVEWLNQVYDQ